MGEGANRSGASRYRIVKCCEDSLRRLKTDRIDLYQIHMQDITVPEEETLRALDDLVSAGKVLYTGCSNYAAYRLADSQWISGADRDQTAISGARSPPAREKFDNEASAAPRAETSTCGRRCAMGGARSVDHAFQRSGQRSGFGPVQFDDKPAAAFQGNAHDDSTALLGDLHRAVTSPRLHCSHRPPSL